MRIIAIANDFPIPLDRGGPVRLLGLAKALAERHELQLLALRRTTTGAAEVAELQRVLGAPVEVFDRPPAAGGAAVRWGRAVAAGRPPWVDAQFSPALRRRARDLASYFDVAVLLDDYAGVYASALAQVVPVAADKHNVMGWSAAAAPRAAGLGARAHRALSVSLTRRFERAYVEELSSVVVTSGEEAARLEQLYGRRADAVVPSAIELPEAAPVGAEPVVGWLGTHEYAPNVDGLLRFVREGWQAAAPEGARLLIAGGSPPASVRELERVPGVEVLGYVEDLDDFLASLAVAVVPLWNGAGVKLKTLTFMGAGIPVAATPVAMEGVAVEPGRHCLIAEDPAALAAAVRELLEAPERARQIGAEGRKLVAEGYTWRSVAPGFVEAVERAASAPR